MTFTREEWKELDRAKEMSGEEALEELKRMMSDPRSNDVTERLKKEGIDMAEVINSASIDDKQTVEQFTKMRDALSDMMGIRERLKLIFERWERDIPIDPMSAVFSFTIALEAACIAPEWARAIVSKLNEGEGEDKVMIDQFSTCRHLIASLPIKIDQEIPDGI